jgi:hypothetical protein
MSIDTVLPKIAYLRQVPNLWPSQCLRFGRLSSPMSRSRNRLRGFLGAFSARKFKRGIKPFTQVLDDSNAPFYHWFADGEINVSYNCLDRHLPALANKISINF